MLVKRGRSAGFSLIELLVVIAIIAILAAILFPIFISAKNTAKTANCQSNMKQLGTAMQIYADSNDGRLPNYSIGNGSARKLWWDFIHPYLKADRIYRCPNLPDSKITTGAYGLNARINGYGVSYPHLFDDPGTRPPILSSIPRPTKTALIFESYTMEMDLLARRFVEAGYPVVYCRHKGHSFSYTGQKPDGNIAGRHGGSSDVKPYGKSVVLYCDMHVKVWPKEYLTQEFNTREESDNHDIWGHFDNISH